MFGWLRQFSRGLRRVQRLGRLQARYDAAQTTAENRRLWQNADDLAPNAATSVEIRRLLRSRARYEVANNPYTDGIIQTLANDIVGDGPRLQMRTASARVNAAVESGFNDWVDAVHLAEELRLFVETVAGQGEGFLRLYANPKLPTPVKLAIRAYEADQITDPAPWFPGDGRIVDGIRFDEYDNAIEYIVLREHPGELLSVGAVRDWASAGDYFATYATGAYDVVPADLMIHVFKRRRPGQVRGVPWITSALPLFAERRGFRQSVLAAARVAAELGAVMLETDISPDEEEALPEPFDTLEIDRGMMTVAPSGYKARQLQPTQPPTGYREYDDKMINEQARPLNMPFNVAACNSSSYNYASGRLDHQTYDRFNVVTQRAVERRVMDRLLFAWIAESMLIDPAFPASSRFYIRGRVPHEYLWTRREHVDPQKHRQAQEIAIRNGISTPRVELERDGSDYESFLAQRAADEEELAELGLSARALSQQQIQGVLAIVNTFRTGALTDRAAGELLVSIGLSRARALAVLEGANVQAPAVPPAGGEESEETPPAAAARRNGNGRIAHARL